MNENLKAMLPLILFIIFIYFLMFLGIFIKSYIIFGISYFLGFCIAFIVYPRDGKEHPFINVFWFLVFPYMATIGNYLSNQEYDEWYKKAHNGKKRDV